MTTNPYGFGPVTPDNPPDIVMRTPIPRSGVVKVQVPATDAPPPDASTDDLKKAFARAPRDHSGSLCALSARLLSGARDCEAAAEALIALAAAQRQRGTQLRREADRLDEIWKSM